MRGQAPFSSNGCPQTCCGHRLPRTCKPRALLAVLTLAPADPLPHLPCSGSSPCLAHTAPTAARRATSATGSAAIAASCVSTTAPAQTLRDCCCCCARQHLLLLPCLWCKQPECKALLLCRAFIGGGGMHTRTGWLVPQLLTLQRNGSCICAVRTTECCKPACWCSLCCSSKRTPCQLIKIRSGFRNTQPLAFADPGGPRKTVLYTIAGACIGLLTALCPISRQISPLLFAAPCEDGGIFF